MGEERACKELTGTPTALNIEISWRNILQQLPSILGLNSLLLLVRMTWLFCIQISTKSFLSVFLAPAHLSGVLQPQPQPMCGYTVSSSQQPVGSDVHKSPVLWEGVALGSFCHLPAHRNLLGFPALGPESALVKVWFCLCSSLCILGLKQSPGTASRGTRGLFSSSCVMLPVRETRWLLWIAHLLYGWWKLIWYPVALTGVINIYTLYENTCTSKRRYLTATLPRKRCRLFCYQLVSLAPFFRVSIPRFLN